MSRGAGPATSRRHHAAAATMAALSVHIEREGRKQPIPAAAASSESAARRAELAATPPPRQTADALCSRAARIVFSNPGHGHELVPGESVHERGLADPRRADERDGSPGRQVSPDLIDPTAENDPHIGFTHGVRYNPKPGGRLQDRRMLDNRIAAQ